MTDDRSHGAFDDSITHWHSSGNEPWASLIAGTQDWVGRCSSTIHDINTQWIDFFHKRVEEDFALPQHVMSCAIEVWSAHAELLHIPRLRGATGNKRSRLQRALGKRTSEKGQARRP